MSGHLVVNLWIAGHFLILIINTVNNVEFEFHKLFQYTCTYDTPVG